MANIYVENDRGGFRVAITHIDPGWFREDYVASCDGCDWTLDLGVVTPLATAVEHAANHLDVDH